MPSNLKTLQWSQDWKGSVFIPITKKGNDKEYSNYHTIALISHASKVMLKILQARLQQYVNWELLDVQAGFKTAKEPATKLPTSNVSWRKQKNSGKISTSASPEESHSDSSIPGLPAETSWYRWGGTTQETGPPGSRSGSCSSALQTHCPSYTLSQNSASSDANRQSFRLKSALPKYPIIKPRRIPLKWGPWIHVTSSQFTRYTCLPPHPVLDGELE